MPDVTMPRLSDSMEEATIVTWNVADGDRVTVGQEIAEVETDKATVPLEAEADGTIALVVAVGETVALGAVIARIAADGEALCLAPLGAGAANAPTATLADPVARPIPGRYVGADEPANARRPLASPLARRLASSLGVELHGLTGTGPRGRIVRGDVTRAAESALGESAVSRAPAAGAAGRAVESRMPGDDGAVDDRSAAPTTAKGQTTAVSLSRPQEIVARRMAESRATVPDFDVTVEVDMESAWRLREQLKSSAAADGIVPSLNDLVVLACGRALREQPNVNSSYRDGRVERYARVNVGVAIATPDSLVVATVFDADRQSLGGVARTTRQLATEVRDGTITPAALAGATFTVSNLGMFGVDRFTAVVNAPQAAILAVGAVQSRAVVRDGELAIRRTMLITLSADHRLLYGADAARFLTRVRDLLEQPLTALVG